MVYNETWYYYAYKSNIDGNLVQPCVADFSIDKYDRNEDIFTKYKVNVGARIVFPDS
jgi:hypothetical protein